MTEQTGLTMVPQTTRTLLLNASSFSSSSSAPLLLILRLIAWTAAGAKGKGGSKGRLAGDLGAFLRNWPAQFDAESRRTAAEAAAEPTEAVLALLKLVRDYLTLCADHCLDEPALRAAAVPGAEQQGGVGVPLGPYEIARKEHERQAIEELIRNSVIAAKNQGLKYVVWARTAPELLTALSEDRELKKKQKQQIISGGSSLVAVPSVTIEQQRFMNEQWEKWGATSSPVYKYTIMEAGEVAINKHALQRMISEQARRTQHRVATVEQVLTAALQACVLVPQYEGLMSRLREVHLAQELQLESLRTFLAGRPQEDFYIPPAFCELASDDWAAARAALAKISEQRTAAGKLGCLVRTARAIIETVEAMQQQQQQQQQQTEGGGGNGGGGGGSQKPLVLSGDDMLPIFIYVVLFSQAPALYSSMDLIEYCAQPDKNSGLRGEGAYYHAVTATALEELARWGKAIAAGKLPTTGKLEVLVTDSDTTAPAPAQDGVGGEGGSGVEEVQMIWSWAADSNAELGRKHDKWVPYSIEFSAKCEQALASGRPILVFDDRPQNHIDLEQYVKAAASSGQGQGQLWQVVTATPNLRRRVRRETVAAQQARHDASLRHAKARAHREAIEAIRRQAEVLPFFAYC